MTDNIIPIEPSKPRPPQPPEAPKAGEAAGERSFREILQDSIEKVNELQLDADKLLERYFQDDPNVKLDHVMVAFRKAQVAFETLMQIRNKLVDAYEQITQMRV
ncbi:MAG: flagellar hook-basal body complex protein FliE [Planctomycetota bacterium]|jgi:flagellar hook-basal body complex protein FliE